MKAIFPLMASVLLILHYRHNSLSQATELMAAP